LSFKVSKKEMDWVAEEITASFNGVIRDAKNMNAEELEVKYAVFKESFAKLYDVAIDSVATGKVQEAHSMLQMMLKARAGMQEGKMTKLTTDMFVGNQLGKKYIYPKTNTPSQNDYKKAFDTINETVKKNEEEDRKKELGQKQDEPVDDSKYSYKLTDQ
jgi:hypothetical protein